MLELSSNDLNTWREMFSGQERWVRRMLQSQQEPLANIPNDAIWNGWFESGDAELYFALLLEQKPQQVIELGSGFSSSFAAQALILNGSGELTCIDPNPRASLPETARHLVMPWQQADPEVFTKLNSGDILFIDSSHTALEALSVYLLLDSLPDGVFVHIHDMLYPGEPQWEEENLMISYFTLRQTHWAGLASLALLHNQLGTGFVDLIPSSAHAPWRSPGSVWLRKRSAK